MNNNSTAGYWKATKVLLALVSPLQKVTPDPGTAHSVCNIQAIKILFNDGKNTAAHFFNDYLKELNEGVNWADHDFKNSSHFLNPLTGKGLWRWPNAITECNLHYTLAKQYSVMKNYKKAMFYLGAAAHLIQDMCVPHHTRGNILKGHQEYEGWVEKEHENYLIDRDGIYHSGANPARWMLSNAKISYNYFPLVEDGGTEKQYHLATSHLLVLAQKTTAGFFNSFYNELIR